MQFSTLRLNSVTMSKAVRQFYYAGGRPGYNLGETQLI